MSVYRNALMQAGSPTRAATGYTLWSWGTFTNGNSGLGNNTAYSSPVQVGDLNDWTPMVCTDSHSSHAIKSDGTLWSWGKGDLLGDGTAGAYSVSSPVQIGSATDWYGVFANSQGNQVYAINTSGELWVWGDNSYGSLGTNNTTAYSSMVQLAGTTWAAIGGGNEHTIAVKTDGTIWGWGNGQNSATWHNNTTTYSSPVQGGSDTTWWGAKGYPPSGGWENGVENAKTFGNCGQGYWSSMVIDEDGKLWGVGWNALGNVAMSGTITSPTQVGTETDWTHLSHVAFGGVGIRDSQWTCWGGYNFAGEWGTGNKDSGAGILTEWDGTATELCKGQALYYEAFNIANFGGTLYYAGDNSNGAYGDGTVTSECSPVQGPGTTDWTRVVAGESHCHGIKPG